MRIMTNKRVKTLFWQIMLCILIFLLITLLLSAFGHGEKLSVHMAVLLGMGTAALIVCYRYFREQDRILEEAVAKIQQYIAGDREARIACDEEGELYRLFHEVNSLAAILNAKAVNEGAAKAFLQNTISDISHQLKTPLAALSIYNGIIQTESGNHDLPEIQEFSSLSEQELDRIETLVQNLLKITKFDAGTIVIEKHVEDVAEMMADVKRRFDFRAGQEGKEIVLTGSESLPLLCDRNWILEAIDNIVKNALDHTKAKDVIEIAWKQSASVLQIMVKDNGSGICPEDMHHIFKRFYRSRFSQDTQGLGLGLPLAKSVVEAHNGSIEVDSRPGFGTAFYMNFLITTKL